MVVLKTCYLQNQVPTQYVTIPNMVLDKVVIDFILSRHILMSISSRKILLNLDQFLSSIQEDSMSSRSPVTKKSTILSGLK